MSITDSVLFMKFQGISFMKKTLIALAVVTSAAVSGSAMAWTTNGTGGSIDVGGTLTPAEKVTPWEVKVGDSVTDLDAKMTLGKKRVDVAITKSIPVLGIRTAANKVPFTGVAGISPQIDFKGALDFKNFKSGVAPLTLDVKDNKGKNIGKLHADLFAGAEYSYVGYWKAKSVMYASKQGSGFYGGLPLSKSASDNNPWESLKPAFPEAIEHYTDQGTDWAKDGKDFSEDNFGDTGYKYSGFYGAVIKAGTSLTIDLISPAAGDSDVKWSASLPVVVSYM
ncbi:TPA: hypothetical protein ACOXE4_004315 [Salmonella enterica]